jgi:hypothetical protein
MSLNSFLRMADDNHYASVRSFQFHPVHGLCYGAGMDDQIIDPAMAASLHADACRTHPLVGWVVMRDPPDYPGKVTARLVTNDGQSPYVLVADTLGDIHAALPPGLERSDRQPAEPPEVVEIWFAVGDDCAAD